MQEQNQRKQHNTLDLENISCTVTKYADMAIHYSLIAYIVVQTVTSFIGLSLWGNPASLSVMVLHRISLFLVVIVIFSLPFRKSPCMLNFITHILPIMFIILLTCLAIISSFFSINTELSHNGAPYRYEGIWSILSYYVLFIASLHIYNKNKQLLILYFIIGSGALQGLYGILQHYHDYFDAFIPQIYAKNGVASSGFIGNPNFFGSFLVLLVGITLAITCLSKAPKYRLYFGLLNVCFFTLAIFSNTTSSWVGIFISYIVGLVFAIIAKKVKTSSSSQIDQQEKKQIVYHWIGIGLIYVCVFLSLNYMEDWVYMRGLIEVSAEAIHVVQKAEISDGMGSFRGYIWKASISFIPQFWLHGCGIDALDALNIRIPGFPDVHVDKVHNEYLHIALTQGIPTLLIYLAFITNILVVGLLNLSKPQKESSNWLSMALFLSFIGYLAQAFFNISIVNVAPYFWIICGFICSSLYSGYQLQLQH